MQLDKYRNPNLCWVLQNICRFTIFIPQPINQLVGNLFTLGLELGICETIGADRKKRPKPTRVQKLIFSMFEMSQQSDKKQRNLYVAFTTTY